MKKIVYFHRNVKCGYSINKVTQTIIRNFSNKTEFYVPCINANLFSLLKNIIFVLFHRDRGSVNHITGDIHYCILALIGCESVLTIHDTVGLDFRKISSLKRLFLEWLWYRVPLKFAKHVVCISNETKKSVLRFTKRTDINVIYNAVSPQIRYSPKKINLDNPRILIIGTSLNKNLLATFDALYGVKCYVVVVGKLKKEQIESLEKNNIQYENKYDLTDAAIIEEYRKCDIVSFLSLYEGFGMPVIEANAVGRPVICSDIPVLREIGADAALFANPFDVSAIRDSFNHLKNDAFLCEKLIDKGRINALRFNKDVILSQWKLLYQNIC